MTLTYLSLVGSLGRAITFWIYGAFSVAALLFVWKFVPETKRRLLEMIEDYWAHGR